MGKVFSFLFMLTSFALMVVCIIGTIHFWNEANVAQMISMVSITSTFGVTTYCGYTFLTSDI